MVMETRRTKPAEATRVRPTGSGGHHDATIEAASLMSVDVETSADSVSGPDRANHYRGLRIRRRPASTRHTSTAKGTPISTMERRSPGVYTPWYYLGELEGPGRARDPGHLERQQSMRNTPMGAARWTSSRWSVSRNPTGTITEQRGSKPQSEMSVDISLEPDPLGGANLS